MYRDPLKAQSSSVHIYSWIQIIIPSQILLLIVPENPVDFMNHCRAYAKGTSFTETAAWLFPLVFGEGKGRKCNEALSKVNIHFFSQFHMLQVKAQN